MSNPSGFRASGTRHNLGLIRATHTPCSFPRVPSLFSPGFLAAPAHPPGRRGGLLCAARPSGRPTPYALPVTPRPGGSLRSPLAEPRGAANGLQGFCVWGEKPQKEAYCFLHSPSSPRPPELPAPSLRLSSPAAELLPFALKHPSAVWCSDS